MMENTCSVEYNVKKVFENVNDTCAKANIDFNSVQIMGVSKTYDSDAVQKAVDAGITLFGENRVQELIEKSPTFIKNNVQCHLIGQLQTNKVKYLPPLTDFIQSLDSLKLANEIEKQYSTANKTANVLIEVNIGNEQSKAGILKQDLEYFIFELSKLPSIRVKGLMCVPPICKNDAVRKYFAEMNKLFVDISAQKVDNVSMTVLSMGMSHDYQYAIMEGSNLVRIGQGIFGQRNYNKT